MSHQLGRVVSVILHRYFGEIVQCVGDDLFTYGSKPIGLIVKSTGLPRSQVVECLRTLLKYDLASFEASNNVLIADYKLLPDNVLLLIRYPRYLLQMKSKYGTEAELLVEELLQEGSCTATVLLVSIALKYKDDKEKNINIVKLKDTFVSLATAGYIQQAPVAELKEGSEVPTLVPVATIVPDLDVRVLMQVFNSGSLADVKDNVYWKVNYDRFHQDFRDEIMIKAMTRRIDENAGELMRLLLEQMYLSSAAWAGEGGPAAAHELRTRARDRPALHTYLDQYLKVLEESGCGFVRRAGDAAGGQYCVRARVASQQLACAALDHLVTERLGSKAARIFRLIREKKYIEEDDIQKHAMLVNKECKELTYKLLEEHFISIQPMRKAASAGGMAKAIYLYHVNMHEVTQTAQQMCYRALHNAVRRGAHERSRRARLVDKQRRVRTIVHGMRLRGEPQQRIDDVRTRCTTHYTQPHSSTSSAACAPSCTACACAASRSNASTTCVLAALHITLNLTRRQAAPRAHHRARHAPARRAAATHRRRAYSLHYTLHSTSLVDKQRRVRTIVHGMRLRGEPQQRIDDVRTRCTTHYTQPHSSTSSAACAPSCTACACAASRSNASTTCVLAALHITLNLTRRQAAPRAHHRARHAPARRAAATHRRRAYSLHYTLHSTSLVDKQRRVRTIVHGMRLRGEPQQRIDDVRTRCTTHYTQPHSSTSSAACAPSCTACACAASRSNASTTCVLAALHITLNLTRRQAAPRAHHRARHAPARRAAATHRRRAYSLHYTLHSTSLVDKQRRVRTIVHGMRLRGEPQQRIDDVRTRCTTHYTQPHSSTSSAACAPSCTACACAASRSNASTTCVLAALHITLNLTRRQAAPRAHHRARHAPARRAAATHRRRAYSLHYTLHSTSLVDKQRRVRTIVHGMRLRGEPQQRIDDVRTRCTTHYTQPHSSTSSAACAPSCTACACAASRSNASTTCVLAALHITLNLTRRQAAPRAHHRARHAPARRAAATHRRRAYSLHYTLHSTSLVDKQRRVRTIVHGMRLRGEPQQRIDDVRTRCTTHYTQPHSSTSSAACAPSCTACACAASRSNASTTCVLAALHITLNLTRRQAAPRAHHRARHAPARRAAATHRRRAYSLHYTLHSTSLVDKQRRVRTIVHGMRLRGEPQQRIDDVRTRCTTHYTQPHSSTSSAACAPSCTACACAASRSNASTTCVLAALHITFNLTRRQAAPRAHHRARHAPARRAAATHRRRAYSLHYTLHSTSLVDKQRRVRTIVHGMRLRGEPQQRIDDVRTRCTTHYTQPHSSTSSAACAPSCTACACAASRSNASTTCVLAALHITLNLTRRQAAPRAHHRARHAPARRAAATHRRRAYSLHYTLHSTSLVDKQRRVRTIVHGMRLRGEPQQRIDDVRTRCTTHYTQPHSSTSSAACAPSCTACACAASRSNASTTCVLAALHITLNLTRRQAAPRAHHRARHAPARRAAATHRRRAYSLHYTLHSTSLVDKQRRVRTIVHGMRLRGEPQQRIDDVRTRCTTHYTQPHSSTSSAACAPSCTACACAASRSNASTTCVLAALHITLNLTRRQAAPRAHHRARHAPARRAAATHRRRAYSLHYTLHSTSLVDKQRRVRTIVHGMRLRGEPQQRIDDVRTRCTTHYTQPHSSTSSAACAPSCTACACAASRSNASTTCVLAALHITLNLTRRQAAPRAHHRARHAPARRAAATHRRRAYSLHYTLHSTSLVDKQRRVRTIVHGMRLRGEPQQRIDDVRTRCTTHYTQPHSSTSSAACAPSCTACACAASRSNASTTWKKL
ncbi:uncharacterized protein LOC115449680 isoform X2 [Manduca sexta]|uniref:uncharacterized protein LOC115449680 isoform X2 n=1 Tax=Manduca sexta TaxID=7130 RepID=UPI00189090FA|nr:uncharacterized protein LOC115449680 isoform X2 [Manduca sexta]